MDQSSKHSDAGGVSLFVYNIVQCVLLFPVPFRKDYYCLLFYSIVFSVCINKSRLIITVYVCVCVCILDIYIGTHSYIHMHIFHFIFQYSVQCFLYFFFIMSKENYLCCNLFLQLEKLIGQNHFLHQSAKEAYRGYLRAYHSHQQKHIFDINTLDLKKVNGYLCFHSISPHESYISFPFFSFILSQV